MRKNDVAEVAVTDVNSLGYGVGRIDGKAIFLPDALPGDLLRVRILKDAGKYYVGKREEILRAAPDRKESPCAAFPRCGGCSFCHWERKAELSQKEEFLRAFLKKEGLEIPVLPILYAKDEWSYRNKIQYPYRNGVLGYYAGHSHRVIENRGCLLHHPAAEKVLEDLKGFLREQKVESYDEITGKGLLRHVCLRTSHTGEEMLLTLVLNGRAFPQEEALLSFLQERHPEVRSLVYNVNEKNTNVIYGEEYLVRTGDGTICDSLLSCEFEMSSASFYQVNHDACEILYREVIARAGLQSGQTVVDLFCGIGAIGICLMKSAPENCRLFGVEIVPQAVENAKRNAARCGIRNASFVCGDANHPTLREADVVIVDPPRKGLEEALIEKLTALPHLERVVYVSCGPDTLARDLSRFLARGWTAAELQPVDLFPKTGHVETVVLLSRK